MAETEQGAKWQQFRRSRMGLAFGLVLTALLSLVALLYGGFLFCLPAILAGAVIYFIPRYFGLKGRKKLVIAGVIIMLLLGLALGFTISSIIKDLKPSVASSSDDILTNGTVDPFIGVTDTNFRFEVTVSGANGSSEVWVEVYDYFKSNEATRFNLTQATNNTDGTWTFYRDVSTDDMPRSLYRNIFFYFNGTAEIGTSTSWGPKMLTDDDILGRELGYNVLYVYVNVGMWFIFIMLGAWYLESSKKRLEEMQKQRKGAEPAKTKQEKFVCSECGADVPGDAKECPQCGEKFDDEEGGSAAKCPYCGKDLGPDATVCWNCGKDLRK